MGFCLFEDADFKGHYLAINSEYIDEFKFIGKEASGQGVCQIRFTQSIKRDDQPVKIHIFGDEENLEATARKASQIGLQKANLNLLNKLSSRPTPLLINQPSRIMVVRELMAEEFMDENASINTASILYYNDGTTRYISERPGQFIKNTNQNGAVPMYTRKGSEA